MIELFFRMGQKTLTTPVDYKLLVNLKSGRWTHPLFPHPLDDVKGKLYCDPLQVSVPYLSGRHGTMQIADPAGSAVGRCHSAVPGGHRSSPVGDSNSTSGDGSVQPENGDDRGESPVKK